MFEQYYQKADVRLLATAIVTIQFFDDLKKQREELDAQERRVRSYKAASDRLRIACLSRILTAKIEDQDEQCVPTIADEKEKLIYKVKRNGVKSLSEKEFKELQNAFQELNS